MARLYNNAARDAAIRNLANLNLELLQDLHALVTPLTDAQYQRVQAPMESSIGAHIRHILECYEQFAKHREAATLSYDRRDRCPELESKPQVALECIDRLCKDLVTLQDDGALELHHITINSDELASRSSIARELAHLIDHTTHHLAMVSVAGKLAQMQLPPELGYSVATLQHLRNQNDKDDPISSHA